MPTIQLSGLASGFDWKSFVDQMMDLERTPANKLESEISINGRKSTALGNLETRLSELRDAMDALNSDGVFGALSSSTTNTNWSSSVASTATAGSYLFSVSQLATAAKLSSASDIGSPIATSNDVTGVTLASLGTGTAVTAGVFTINGSRVTVDLGDSLDDLFTSISTATNGAVTATYNSTTDKIELASGSAIVLGSSTDTSNFLSVARLANNGTGAVSSSSSLGAVTPTATLDSSRLRTAVTETNGSFSINGVSISYNASTDTLNSIISRINDSAAGVTASFDPTTDKVTLKNNSTGDVGFSVADSTGNLMAALGLTSFSGLTRGQNAEFTINGGSTLTSTSNTLTEDVTGITGLTVTPSAEGGTETVTVSANTTSARSKLDTFITKFNALQSYIDDQTKVTSTNGKVSSAILSDNREVQSWGKQLRSAIFDSVPGLSSTLSRLDHIGLDFTGTSAQLTIKDESKLTAALRDRPDEVSALFRQSTTGIAARLDKLFDAYIGSFGGSGLLNTQKSNLTKRNDALTTQIAEIDRRLVQRRAQLEASFFAMESAQSTIKNMQTQLINSFGQKQSSNNG